MPMEDLLMVSNTLRLLRRPEVIALTGLGRSRIDQLERAGRFPARIRISDRATGWRSDEIRDWIESRPRAAEADSDTSAHLRAAQDRRGRGDGPGGAHQISPQVRIQPHHCAKHGNG